MRKKIIDHELLNNMHAENASRAHMAQVLGVSIPVIQRALRALNLTKKPLKDEAPVGFKTCRLCLVVKPLHLFAKRTASTDGTDYRCLECHSTATAEYRARNPEKVRDTHRRFMERNRTSILERRRDTDRDRTFGLTTGEFDKLLKSQSGVCAICGLPETRKSIRLDGTTQPLCVDHDHRTGRVRGLLCSKCNCGIGYFNDDPNLTVAATAYLKRAGVV